MSARALAAALAAVLCAAPVARADDVWRSAAIAGDRAKSDYESAMLAGDDAVGLAANAGDPVVRQRLIQRALEAYDVAARAQPADPEPHFRAAAVLRSFYVDCPPDLCDGPIEAHPARAALLIEHWNEFERLAPGDPRIAEDILFSRAVLRTKLGTDDDLRAARDDYRKLIDLRPDRPLPEVFGNLAETYMMLGDLDRAIDTYRVALARGADLSQEYGLAVALDRDEQGSEARAIIQARGERGLLLFERLLDNKDIFYVPDGEQFYYLALALEANGNYSMAIEAWDAFIASGAHPQFAPRARHNRAALARLVAPSDARRRMRR